MCAPWPVASRPRWTQGSSSVRPNEEAQGEVSGGDSHHWQQLLFLAAALSNAGVPGGAWDPSQQAATVEERPRQTLGLGPGRDLVSPACAPCTPPPSRKIRFEAAPSWRCCALELLQLIAHSVPPRPEGMPT